jgi:hypothetical protein
MSYAKELSFSSEIGAFVLEETQKLALAIDRDVVLQTPVDTARAASNWIVTTDSSTGKTVGIIGQAAAISNGASAIGKARPFFSIYIQNNLPYIGRLNDGYSQKAPSKYVDTIITKRVNE